MHFELIMPEINGPLDEQFQSVELLRKLDIFTENEIESIVQTRKKNKHLLNAKFPLLDNYFNAIQYETALVEKIKNPFEKESSLSSVNRDIQHIVFSINENIKRLYLLAIDKYESNYSLWISFLEFCKRLKYWGCGSKMLLKFTQIFSNNDVAWSFAVEWTTQSREYERSKSILVDGLKLHPSSPLLQLHHIKKELELASSALKMRESRQALPEEDSKRHLRKDLVRSQCVELAYLTAKEVVTDQKFYKEVYELTKNNAIAARLHSIVEADIAERFTKNEIAWETKALEMMKQGRSIVDVDSNCEKKMSVDERINAAVDIFKEGLKEIPSDTMWMKYLDFLFYLNEDKCAPGTLTRRAVLYEGFEAALTEDRIKEGHMFNYIKHLLHSGRRKRKVIQLLAEATNRFPTSKTLWIERIRFYLLENQAETAMGIFRRATVALEGCPDSEFLQLINYSVAAFGTVSTRYVDEIFREGIKTRPEISHLLKPQYLSWKIQSGGFIMARLLAEDKEMIDPPCLEFYQKLCFYESIQIEPSLKTIKQIHETLIFHFGENNPGVWSDYLQFSLKYEDKNSAAIIYARAKNFVSEEVMTKLESLCSDYTALTPTLS